MNKKKTTLAVALVVMGIAVLGLSAAVFAKYVTTLASGNGGFKVAKWAFAEDNASGVVDCNIETTAEAGTLVNGRIAPGTTGVCKIELSNEHSEVGVDYTIKIKNIINYPANVKFYTNRTGNATTGYTYNDADKLTPGGTEEVTGYIAAQTAGPVTESIYWVWDYETGAVTDGIAAGDESDTASGKTGATMTIQFDITGVQHNPTVAP